jgi:hypothetical protein
MVTLAGSQVWWTWETEDVFDQVKIGDKHAMKKYAVKLTDQLSGLTQMVSRDIITARFKALGNKENASTSVWQGEEHPQQQFV